MALQFNAYAKNNILLQILNIYGSGASNSLKIYPSSVPLPTLPPSTTAPAGFLVNFTNFTTSRPASPGNQLKLTTAPAATAAVATGVPSWFFWTNGTNVMIGDSIGLAGSAPIVTLSSMSLTSGTSYSLLDMTLTMV